MPGARTRSARALALLVSALVVLTARAATADGPAPDPSASPAAAALLAGEDVAQGTAVPELRPAPDLAALVGKPILRVEVVVLGDRWTGEAHVTRVRPGDPLSLEAARKAMRELTDSGAFARASAEARPEGDGVVLVIDVVPRRLIASIQVHGGVLDVADTLEAGGVSDGGEITAPLVPIVGQRIRAFYADHGFTAAKVTVDTTETDDPMRVALRIEIEPGAPRVISQRVFVVDPAVDREIGDLKSAYRLGTGARVDDQQLDDADRAMTDLLRKKGFYRADVRHVLRHVGPYSYLYIYLDAGPRLAPSFEGNRAYDADQLTQALELDKTVATKPSELVDRLRAFYVQRGFYDVTVDAEERGGPKDAVHYLVMSIHEGRRVTVEKRIFACLPARFPKDATELTPDRLGEEIDSYLEEELPGAEPFWAGSPRAVDALFGPTSGAGGRAEPIRLEPVTTFAPETYDRAIKHLRDLFHSEGYLNAVVGPMTVVRAHCRRDSLPGRCIPEPLPDVALARCEVDRLGLPVPEPPVPEAMTCVPDPARGVECAPTVTLRIPTSLGPRTTLYDVAVEGNRAFDERFILDKAGLTLGSALSNVELEAARLRVLDAYKGLGYAYAEVRTSIEPSPDRTRARVRFSISERDLVMVSGFVVKGAVRTDERLILGRVALKTGAPYMQELVRLSEERVATLGTFSSVSVGLEDPEVPQKQKRVVVTVSEQLPQYLDPRVGFSTGEGVRFAFEYGHRNIAGEAISLTLRVQLSYLFDFMILDPQVKENLGPLPVSQRLERRNTASITFPEIGLGPLISLSVDGIDVRDNQRDFGLTRQALLPTLTFRPRRAIRTDLGASVELNDVQIFNADNVTDAIKNNPALSRLLRVPDGRTFAVSQRLGAQWDRRDNPFAATQGILLAGAVEHVNAFPSDGSSATITSHFLRFTSKVAGYVRLTKKGTALAMSLGAGYIQHLDAESKTYPDRLLFLGGVDSVRSFLTDSLVPEDLARRILKGTLSIDDVGIRGGDVSLNPRLELRVPMNDTFSIGLFLDTGNVWVDPKELNPLALRYAAGAGLRIATPIGPLALDYGVNLDRRPWEDVGAFHFSIGLF